MRETGCTSAILQRLYYVIPVGFQFDNDCMKSESFI